MLVPPMSSESQTRIGGLPCGRNRRAHFYNVGIGMLIFVVWSAKPCPSVHASARLSVRPLGMRLTLGVREGVHPHLCSGAADVDANCRMVDRAGSMVSWLPTSPHSSITRPAADEQL